MSKRLVWWQAYKAALAGGHMPCRAEQFAYTAVEDYLAASKVFGKEMAS